MQRPQDARESVDLVEAIAVVRAMERRAQRRHDIGRDGDAAVAPGPAERRLGRVVARHQEELAAESAAQSADARHVGGGVRAEAGDARQSGQPLDRQVVERAGVARRHVGRGSAD